MAQTNNVAATITKASGSISVTREGKVIELQEGDSVYATDVVKTGQNTAEFTFADGSKAMLATNTTMTVEEFSFDSTSASDASFVLNLAVGAMRSISGQVVEQNPDAFKVITPKATVGIRGTDYITEVGPDQSVKVMVIELSQGHNVVVTSHMGQQLSISNPNEGAFIGGEPDAQLVPMTYSQEQMDETIEKITQLLVSESDEDEQGRSEVTEAGQPQRAEGTEAQAEGEQSEQGENTQAAEGDAAEGAQSEQADADDGDDNVQSEQADADDSDDNAQTEAGDGDDNAQAEAGESDDNAQADADDGDDNQQGSASSGTSNEGLGLEENMADNSDDLDSNDNDTSLGTTTPGVGDGNTGLNAGSGTGSDDDDDDDGDDDGDDDNDIDVSPSAGDDGDDDNDGLQGDGGSSVTPPTTPPTPPVPSVPPAPELNVTFDANDSTVEEDVTPPPGASGDQIFGSISATQEGASIDISNNALNVNGADLGIILPGGDALSTGNYGTLAISDSGTYTYTLDNSKVQGLGAGQTAIETFTIQVKNAHGGTTTKTLDITVQGTEDPHSAATVVYDEDNDMNSNESTLTGKIEVTDVDRNDTYTYEDTDVATPFVGTYGNLTINANGTFTYTLDPAKAGTIGPTLTVQDTFTIDVTNGGTTVQTTITIDITGVNGNPPSISVKDLIIDENAPAGVEAQVTLSSTPTPAYSIGGAAAALYGTAGIDANGVYTYDIDTNNATVNALKAGQTLTDKFTIVAGTGVDSTQKEVTVTIVGQDDAATVGVPSQNLVVGDDGVAPDIPSAFGTITITDPDSTIVLSIQEDGDTVNGNTFVNEYGTFTVVPNVAAGGGQYTYTFTLNAAKELGAGETETFRYKIFANGIESQEIVVTINGGYTPSTSTYTRITANENGTDTINIEGEKYIDGNLNRPGALTDGNSADNKLAISGSVLQGTIQMANGNDSLSIQGDLTFESASAVISIDGGAGADTVSIGGSMKHGTITTGDGADSVIILGDLTDDAGNNISIDAGADNDSIYIGSTMKAGSLKGDTGDDTITIKEMTGGSIDGGDDNDTITINKLVISEDAASSTISAGAGNDSIIITLIEGEHGTVTGHDGNDSIIVHEMKGGGVHGDNIAAGNDTIIVNNMISGNIFAGKGADLIEVTLSSNTGEQGRPEINVDESGSGNDGEADQIFLTMHQGTNEASITISKFGNEDKFYFGGTEYTTASKVTVSGGIGGEATIADLQTSGEAAQITDTAGNTMFIYFT